MIRLLTIRVLISAWKRALSISDKLKPRTWAYLTVSQAVLAAICFWGYRQSHKPEAQPFQQNLVRSSYDADLASPFAIGNPALRRGLDMPPEISLGHVATVEHVEARYARNGYGIQTRANYAAYNCVDFVHLAMATSDNDAAVDVWKRGVTTSSEGAYYGQVFNSYIDSRTMTLNDTSHQTFAGMIWGSDYQPRLIALTSRKSFPASSLLSRGGSVSAPADEWFDFRRLPRLAPNVVMQLTVPESTSLLSTLQKIVLLVQGIFFTIGSALASVFGLIGYQRGKADLKLKQLQIRELEIKLEIAERERTRAMQESTRSSIILLT